jgi:MFS family permease
MFVRTPQMIWLIYPLLFVETIGWAFFEPGRSAVIPSIVPEDQVITANTLSATTWSFNLAIGSALGGVAAALFGRDTVFLLNAASFLASAALLRRMKFHEPHAEGGRPLRAKDLVDYSPVVEGVRYVARDRRLTATLFVKGGLGFLGANLVLLPLLGERVFPLQWPGLDTQRAAMLGMSLLMGARGLGAMAGPLITAPMAKQRDSAMRGGILLGYLAIVVGYAILSWSPFVWIACLALILAHGGGSTIWVFSTTLLHKNTEDRFRGRVFSADLGMNTIAVSASSYLAGAFIDAGTPVRDYALYTGLGLLIPASLWFWALRRLWKSG